MGQQLELDFAPRVLTHWWCRYAAEARWACFSAATREEAGALFRARENGTLPAYVLTSDEMCDDWERVGEEWVQRQTQKKRPARRVGGGGQPSSRRPPQNCPKPTEENRSCAKPARKSPTKSTKKRQRSRRGA